VTTTGTITLSTGRKLGLCALTQELTYEGLLEGVPTTTINKRHMDSLVAELRAKRGDNSVYLVTPVERPIYLGQGEQYPFGPPAHLPGVTCVGRFRSDPIVEKPGCFSELTIIWCQRDFALPIYPSVLEEITRLDWDLTRLG
jgi:hypothetical protein